MSFSLHIPILFQHLQHAHHILIAGAGGGFDIYAGLGLAHALAEMNKRITLANLSFTALSLTEQAEVSPHLYRITANTIGPDNYFPERDLTRFLQNNPIPNLEPTVYGFAKTGVNQLLASYQYLIEQLRIDAIVLIDGGTDILMFGNEFSLGTPVEDMTSLAAVGQIRLAQRHVACLGFGIDTFHGINHAHFLENVAQLEQDGGYYGAFSISRQTTAGAYYLKACAHLRDTHSNMPSIVNGSIEQAMLGQYGDTQFTDRTAKSKLYINPLMPIYFSFDLMALCKRNLYLRELVGSSTLFHTSAIINSFHAEVKKRRPKRLPM